LIQLHLNLIHYAIFASYMLAAAVASVAFHAATGLFAAGLNVGDNATGINFCLNGDCGLIGETSLIAKGCYSAVSVFTVDYDVPSCGLGAVDQASLLGSLEQNVNSTTLVGGLNGTSTVGSNGTVTGPSVTSSISTVVTGGAGSLVRSQVTAGFLSTVMVLLIL